MQILEPSAVQAAWIAQMDFACKLDDGDAIVAEGTAVQRSAVKALLPVRQLADGVDEFPISQANHVHAPEAASSRMRAGLPA
ncbi:hypothetical protein [Stenotrophomonas sp. SY1]|uniref:hypothetical protein n=1 Tax=Stenotrophomonas sp. SY1 TaxID=477235 RepID=UPI001E47B58A|nr:hypothetical protein [Stenotrophomonas sp. SY1]MCD9087001.1 hypothetical protein [Stenotrophomonas sp. SY1]